ncbi:DUF4339 domain-containing protein [Paraflavitalea soli]|uniref:DUF4339 domain-containing protein n=1 Tax=Paraflavitalea soli TaxID=2315862 RepID=A0A3B7MIV1_9BACT|nr:DUF4339 domain-containing protein [Paraflavitalea soli]AXY73159.1 DUF4339 domain-containing protein [Paraflavitalea soli]
MNKYLLLRDNKQTGPYSVEELTTKGLKPYDLVWLDGKSAAWRYPSEIAELKAFAPAVEEQPYDRFYKKNTAQQAATQASQTNSTYQQPVHTEAIVVTTPVTGNSTPQPVIAKKIYVTLPAGAGNRGTTSTTTANGKTTQANSQATDKEDSPASLLNEKFARLREEKIKQAESAAANPVIANQTATSEETPVPGFSEIVEKNHPRQEEKLAHMPQPRANNHRLLMRSIAAACLLLGGVIIGLVISNNRQQKDSAALDKLVKQIQERDRKNQLPAQEAALPLTPNNLTSIDNNPAADQQQPAVEPNNNNKQETIGTPVNHKVEAPAMKESLPVKDVSQRQTVKVIPALVTNKPAGPPVSRQEVEQARKNIHQLVAVDANKYKTGVLGGISDLQLTISNNSLYPLDEVQVEVRYLGPEKRVVKTQLLLFSDVAPGEQKTVEAPRTNRGVTVDYVITRINSKALGLAHAGY